MRQETNFGKVIIRTKDKKLHRGFSKADFIGDTVQLIDEKGNQQEFDLDELKAVFFVRNFEGDPEYSEVKFLGKESGPPWLWIHVLFDDGEVLEGRARNSISLLDTRGFFVWLSDEEANNETVFIVRSAIREFRVMGLK